MNKHDKIPNELTKLKKYAMSDKDKKPIQTVSGYFASCNEDGELSSFKDAVQEYEAHPDKYIGICFSITPPYAVIDIDLEHGKITQEARDLIRKLDSYTERSVNKGFHIIVKTSNDDIYIKDQPEIYSRTKFITLTGDVYGDRDTINERTSQLEYVIQKYHPTIDKPTQSSSVVENKELTPSEIEFICDRELQKAISESHTGNRDNTGMDLACQLRDNRIDISMAETVIRQYQSSVSQEGHPYTLDKALRTLKGVYNGTPREPSYNFPIRTQKEAEPVGSVNQEPKVKGANYFVDRTFIPPILAKELSAEYNFIYSAGILYVYLDGVFSPCGIDFVKQECYQRLGDRAKINHVSEVVANIQYTNLTDHSKLNTYKHLINLENGMYDYRDGKLLEHSKDYLSTIRIPVSYDINADNSIITDWLASILDPQCTALILELFGYCLIPDTTMQKAFMLVGEGNSGKSTLLNILEKVIGEDNVSKIPLQEISENKFKRAELFGKLVNLFADLDNRDLESTSYFKTIVAGDSIDAERKCQDMFNFRPFSRLIFSANEIPRCNDRSSAYYKRWSIIKFDHVFVKGVDEKKGFSEILSTKENLSALLNCALSGLKNVMKHQSFSESESVNKAMQDYEKQNDPVKAFIDECCQFDPSERTERGLMYDSFTAYCVEMGFKTITRNTFYQRLRTVKQVTDVRARSERFFEGIKYLST